MDNEHPLVTSNIIGMMDCATYNGAFNKINNCVMKFCRRLAFNIESNEENKITKAHVFMMAYVVSVHDCTSAFDMSAVEFLFTLFEIGTCFSLLYHPTAIPMNMDDMT